MTASFSSRSQSVNLSTCSALPLAWWLVSHLILSSLSTPTYLATPSQAYLQGYIQYMWSFSSLRAYPCGRILVSVPGELTSRMENAGSSFLSRPHGCIAVFIETVVLVA